MDPYNYSGFGFTRLNRKTRSLSCLLSAISYCVVGHVFLILLHLDDISESLFLITTIIDKTILIKRSWIPVY